MKTKLSVFTALLLALTLVCACALAATANATIVAPDTVKITAPFAGTLKPFLSRSKSHPAPCFSAGGAFLFGGSI